jgi:hypothetical protein
VKLRSLAALTFVAMLLPASGVMAEEAYSPAKGDEVVVYTHRFKAENFVEGVKLVEEGFTSAQAAAGQTRRNYFLVNPTNYEIIVVSTFAPGSGVDEWHKFMGRLDLLKTLEPMRSEPLKLQRYTLDAVTSAP